MSKRTAARTGANDSASTRRTRQLLMNAMAASRDFHKRRDFLDRATSEAVLPCALVCVAIMCRAVVIETAWAWRNANQVPRFRGRLWQLDTGRENSFRQCILVTFAKTGRQCGLLLAAL